MAKVLVCGGRNFVDRAYVYAQLDKFHNILPITTVVSGCAAGVDSMGIDWADDKGIPCERYPADWRTHGKAAGPIRNQQMLDEGKPDYVLAFPGGRGTADMVRRSRRSGIKVMEFE